MLQLPVLQPGRAEMLLPQTRPCPVGVFFVEKNVLFDPIQISLFSFIGILFQAQGIADSIEKLFGKFLPDIINYRN